MRIVSIAFFVLIGVPVAFMFLVGIVGTIGDYLIKLVEWIISLFKGEDK